MPTPAATAPCRIPERHATRSYWRETSGRTAFPPLQEDARADVAIVGAGIAGLVAAHVLAKEGKDVLVLDRYGVAEGESCQTTAHVTHVVDTRLRDLVRLHGEEGAKAAWDSSASAIDLLERIVRDEGIACDWQRLDGVLYGVHDGDERVLAEEATWARRFGYEAEAADPAGVPFACRAALRFPGQAKFHPRRFLLGLAERLAARGVRIHEGTEVREAHERGGAAGGGRLTTRDERTVEARAIVSASNVPLFGRVAMPVKTFPYRSYVVAARVPPGRVGDALWWSTFAPGEVYGPYHYARVEPSPDGDLVILGGEDHKVGQAEDPGAAWGRLEGHLAEAAGGRVEVERRWSGQVIETADGLPYIGVHPGSPPTALMATGFSGNGMTFGALAGWMLAERALGRSTRWDGLYDPGRLGAGLGDLVRENLDFPRELAAKPFKGSEAPGIASLQPGEGAVLVHGGRRIAAYRDERGGVQAVKADCTHLGCTVRFNPAEASWDCPCHGSRFAPDGSVVNGPATAPLERVEVRGLGGPLQEAERDEARPAEPARRREGRPGHRAL